MKRTLAAALIAAAFTANAAGPYDGVYQSNTNPQLFYSLHQNGSALLMTTYTGIPSDGSIVFRFGSANFAPSTIYTWEVQGGQVVGNRAILTGGSLQNSCNVTIQLDITPSEITGTVLSSLPSTTGVAQGMPCSTLIPIGFTAKATRMF